MRKYAFGIDIGGTTVKIGFFETAGRLVKKWEIPTRKDNGGEMILCDIANAISKELKKQKIELNNIEGIGMGIPGPVLENGIVNKCVNLGWGVINVQEEMSKLTGELKVRCGNDANVAALGEMWKGGGKGHNNIVMVTLGTGVGGGVIIDGKIVPGAFGAGGEIGHIKVSKTETAVCGCGKTGCLEQYVSATGLVRMAQKYLNENKKGSMLRNVKYLSAKTIFDAAKSGDELSGDLIEKLGETLGTALSYIACVVDPEIFVLGGGVSKAGDILVNTVQKYYRETAFHASRDTAFALAELGNDAGIYGAVRLVL